jgi:hypothetical protein
VKCLDLVGVVMLFFVKTTLKGKIKNFDHIIVKTGMMGTMGNKGSCLMRFNYLDSSFAFATGHLCAGGSANSSRIAEITEVLNKPFPNLKDLKFREHDICFVFGDLNFRIDLDLNTCKELIKKGSLAHLTEFDQFLKSKSVNYSLFDIEEGPLTFNPTYKYVYGGHEYESKKKRVPSWTDRVLFKKSKFLKQLSYGRAEYTHSDHRPVYSTFKVYAFAELKDEKDKIIKEIKQNIVLGINSHSISPKNKSVKIFKEETEENKNTNILISEPIIENQLITNITYENDSTINTININDNKTKKEELEMLGFFK